MACIQEPEGEKAGHLGDVSKIFYIGKSNTRIGMAIVVDRHLKEKIGEQLRENDKSRNGSGYTR